MPGELARQWFVPGEGIDRHVISADIQRYLGNDATVRPGVGTAEHEGQRGYWIKAYRNLTTAMIADLKADSLRWRQEQQQTGTRGGYEGSNTYATGAAGRNNGVPRRGGDSPIVEGPYQPPVGRGPANRMPMDGMDIDMPQGLSQPDRRYPGDRGYPVENRPYPGAYPQDSRNYPSEQPLPPNFGRPPVSSPPGPDPRYAPNYPQPNGGPPPGYQRPGEFLPPFSPYEQAPPMQPRPDPNNFGAQIPYGAQQSYSRNEPRDPRAQIDPRDPQRYPPEPYQDPRYAYPSPPYSVPDREAVAGPQQLPSPYGAQMPPQYDQYGRPVQRPPSQQDLGFDNQGAMAVDRDPIGRDRIANLGGIGNRPHVSGPGGNNRPPQGLNSGNSREPIRDSRDPQRRRIR